MKLFSTAVALFLSTAGGTALFGFTDAAEAGLRSGAAAKRRYLQNGGNSDDCDTIGKYRIFVWSFLLLLLLLLIIQFLLPLLLHQSSHFWIHNTYAMSNTRVSYLSFSFCSSFLSII